MPGRSPNASAALSPAELEQALRDATASMARHDFGPRTARIRDLRHALAGRVSREEFDEGVLSLQQNAIVDLAPHGHPELLGSSEILEALLLSNGSVLYLLRWLR